MALLLALMMSRSGQILWSLSYPGCSCGIVVELSFRCRHFINTLNHVISMPMMIPGAPSRGFWDQ